MNTLNLKVFYQARKILVEHAFEEGEVCITVPSIIEMLNSGKPIILDDSNKECTNKTIQLTKLIFKACKYCSSPGHCWYEWELVSWK